MLRKAEACDVARIPERTLQTWIDKCLIVPAVPGREGRGNGAWFTSAQVIGLVVAGHLRASERGCTDDYAAEIVNAFQAMGDAGLARKLRAGRTHFVMVHQGKPVLQGGEDVFDWPDVRAAVESVEALRAAAVR